MSREPRPGRERPMGMGRLRAVLALSLVVGACASDGPTDQSADDPIDTVAGVAGNTGDAGDAGDTEDTEVAATTSTQGGTMSDPTSPDAGTSGGTEPDESAAGGTDATGTTGETKSTEPDADDRAATTLELNPPKTSPPPTTAGVEPAEPVGGDESLYAGQIDPGLNPFVDLAVADLATRLGIAEADITTISATLVTWPDSSMGCPMPGMVYASLLEDGSLIELGFDGKVYRYHSGGQRTPFLCDPAFATPPASGGSADV